MPTLVVWGTADPIVPASYADDWARLLAAERRLLDGCGHAPLVERPDAVATLTHEFLSQNSHWRAR